MAATLARPGEKATPPAASSPPTSPPTHLASPSVQRNASTSSSRSTTTVSSTASVQAVPMRPPPIETSTAATSRSQLPSRAQSESEGVAANGSAEYASTRGERYAGPGLGVGGRGGWGRNGPRTGAVSISPTPGGQYLPPTILTSSPSSPILNLGARVRPSGTQDGSGQTGTSPTTPRGQLSFASQPDESSIYSSSPVPLRVTISLDPQDQLSHEHDPSSSFYSLHPYGHDQSPTSAGNAPSSPVRGRPGHLTTPSSPTAPTVALRGKARTLSVDGGSIWAAGRRSGSLDAGEREKRQSQLSIASASSGVKKPSIRDYVLGEELGQGSYSTVYAATAATASSSTSPTSTRPPRKYAIKIINQHHLVQEKKVKYAMIERDALVRLSTPRTTAPSSTRGHRRGLSSSSSGGYAAPTSAAKRKSTASANPTAGQPNGAGIVGARKDTAKDRLSIATTDSGCSSSPVLTASSGSTQLSPVMGGKSIAGRRPSRSAEPPEMVPEQAELLAEALEVEDLSPSAGGGAPMGRRSRPPSPVKEEPSPVESPDGHRQALSLALPVPPTIAPILQQPPATPDITSSPLLAPGSVDHTSRDGRDGREVREARTPKKRRQSLAPSERSVKSSGGGGGGGTRGQAHPGVIRLHSTFNDSTSLYFVLDLASNGELASFIRKFGSLDVTSARYYAAQLIDTIEFMHDKGVIHRDLKPENILLDDDMRIKITDFGSAKLIGKDEEQQDGESKKRSFVGSADFVSPEVLRNEAASTASDIWAFGCILYQFLVGKPPFRGATDYLTFQKILKREMEYPEGFDEQAKELINAILDLEPAQRPTPAAIKLHPFFAPIDFATIWTVPAPAISTGLRPPVTTFASLDPASDIWGVFDDEASDGGFEYDREDDDLPEGSAASGGGPLEGADVGAAAANGDERARERERERGPHFDPQAAAHAVRHVNNPGSAQIVYTPADAYAQVDLSEELDPPRPAYAMGWAGDGGAENRRKSRGWSQGSSSSGGNRSALTGWLEAIRIGGGGAGSAQSATSGVSGAGHGVRSNRTSRTSVRSDEYGVMLGSGALGQGQGQAGGHTRGSMEMRLRISNGVPGGDKWAPVLLANESIIFTSPILVRTSSPSLHLPFFLLPAAKRRQLILTDFPRLVIVKDDHPTGTAATSTTPVQGVGVGGVTPRGETPEPGASTAHPSPLAQAIQQAGSSPSPNTSPAPGPSSAPALLRIKGECVFVVRPSGATDQSGVSGVSGVSGMSGSTLGAAAGASGMGVPNRVLEVQEKGSKGFYVQTPSTTYWYTADSAELRDRWMTAIRRITL